MRPCADWRRSGRSHGPARALERFPVDILIPGTAKEISFGGVELAEELADARPETFYGALGMFA
jgi:hypothetical protein